MRQVQMAQSKEVVIDTIRLILDDDSDTQLSLLRQVDIHLVAHAMKWAIRYSEETLVTYADYQALYLDQGKKERHPGSQLGNEKANEGLIIIQI